MNSIQASLSSFVGSIQIKTKIDEATSPKDDPTPIYLLDETVQMIGNKPDNVNAAIDALKARLSHRSPNVKQKALRLIKHCCQKGSPEFKRAMSRHSYVVKDLTSFKCPPDPFKGDIPWKRVQEAARECLEAMHAAPDNNNSNMNNNAYQSYLPTSGYDNNRGGRRMEGFGSGTGDGGSAAAHGEMMAFGNTPLEASSSSSGSNQRSSSLLGTFTTGVNLLSNSISSRPNHHRLPSTEHQWVNDQPSYGQHPAVLSQPIAALDNNNNTNTTQHQQSSTPEGALVNKICTPSGLRAVPETADLKAFVAAAAAASATINVTEISQLLEEKCEKGPWQASLRALCAIAALVEGGGEVGGETAVYFQAHPDTVRKMAGHPQATLRQRADRVLKLIGADTLPNTSSNDNDDGENKKKNSGTSGDLSDLLFGDDSGSNAAAVEGDVVPSATSAAGVVDLFSGLDMSTPTTITTQQPSSAAAAAAPLLPDVLFQDPFQQQAPPAPSSSGIADPFFVEQQPCIDLLNISSPQKPSPMMMMGGSNSNGNGNGGRGMKSMRTGGSGGGGSGGKDGAFNFIESQLNEMKVTKKK